MFNSLPKPKTYEVEDEIIKNTDNITLSASNSIDTKSTKERTRIKIRIPSVSEFQDLEERPKKKQELHTTKTNSLFSILPPPKHQITKKILIPQILNKKESQKKSESNIITEKVVEPPAIKKTSISLVANYDSESEDENESSGDDETLPSNKVDFFSLKSTSNEICNTDLSKFQTEPVVTDKYSVKQENHICVEDVTISQQYENHDIFQPGPSSVNSQKEVITIKNNVEIGPKLPVPEQEYNLDSDGNVAIDDKAIQYLCGKRGMKRKTEELESANIIDINGEDIKPDEREWLVKALTEKPIHRPVSLGVGPGGQFKKKHQITYLAHQAKAMELELQNQWSQNRLTRQQTQSKYGF